ncbi:arginase family protein [Corynebacterium frankenforstense]
MYTPFDPADWTGRDDGPGREHARWHSVITGVDPRKASGAGTGAGAGVASGAGAITGAGAAGLALLGFASDEGVERNGGRRGAAAGPAALRKALAGLAVHDEIPRFDAGTVRTEDPDLEGAQRELSNAVRDLVRAGRLVVALGGGHEIAWATHRGLFEAVAGSGVEGPGAASSGSGADGDAAPAPAGERGRIAVVNLDAHFDLRAADRPTSGTPFLQIARLHGAGGPAAEAHDFDYTVLGISKPNNTRVLFETAEALGVRTVLDDELAAMTPREAGELVAEAVAGADHVHLSIDLDGLPAAVAPGVSAPAAVGVSLAHYRAMAAAAAESGKLRLVDIAELNPSFDVDGRTAKVAARMVADIEERALGTRR